ncbi:unnamed protein product, partial [Prorocentrum cordatum]
ARELGYPMRLLWMLLQLYQQPRCIKAYGSLSSSSVAFQGVLAGCTHATYLTYLLTCRVLQRASGVAPTIKPRSLVDVIGLQMVSPDLGDVKLLLSTAMVLTAEARDLGLILQPAKSAVVAGSAQEYDPIYHATLDLVLNYAAWIWDGRASPSRLQRAWTALHERGVPISWANAKGPLAATWLTLRRLAWGMKAPRVLQGDMGSQHDLYRVCPADLRPFLVQGVRRWQHDRLASHMYSHAGAPIWHRGLRYAVKGVRAARQLGSLQALWSDNIPAPIRRGMKLGMPIRQQVHDRLESRGDPTLPSRTGARQPSAMEAEGDFFPGVGQGVDEEVDLVPPDRYDGHQEMARLGAQ